LIESASFLLFGCQSGKKFQKETEVFGNEPHQSPSDSVATMADAKNGEPQGPRPLQMGAKGAYIVRLLMVGDSACGKTSLVLRFDQNVFSTKFVTTIGVDYRDKMVRVRDKF
jgi:Ras family